MMIDQLLMAGGGGGGGGAGGSGVPRENLHLSSCHWKLPHVPKVILMSSVCYHKVCLGP